MVLTFLRHTKGSGSPAFNYLLGINRDRDGAELLSGDPELTRDLINSLSLKQRNTYVSSVMNFGDEPNLTDEIIQKAIEEYSELVSTGLEDAPETVFIKHTEKGKTEIHAITPKVGDDGKAYNPYYSKSELDFDLFDNWKNKFNTEHNLIDPNNPARIRVFSSANLNESLGHRQIKKSVNLNFEKMLVEQGSITREQIKEELETMGFEISKQTKKSLSFTYEGGKKPIRLTGELYNANGYSPKSENELIELSAEHREEQLKELGRIQQQHRQNLKSKTEFNKEFFHPSNKQSEQMEQAQQHTVPEIKHKHEQQDEKSGEQLQQSSRQTGFINGEEIQRNREELQQEEFIIKKFPLLVAADVQQSNNDFNLDLLSSGFIGLGEEIEQYKKQIIINSKNGTRQNIKTGTNTDGTTADNRATRQDDSKTFIRDGDEKREGEIQKNGFFGTIESIAEETTRTNSAIGNIDEKLSATILEWNDGNQGFKNELNKGIERKQQQNRRIDGLLGNDTEGFGSFTINFKHITKQVVNKVQELIDELAQKIKNSFGSSSKFGM